MTRVRRFDMVEFLQPVQETPEGILLLEGIVAKPGVLEYRQPDGTVIRELIPRSELERADSLATLGLKPYTNEHPKVPVDIDNMAEFRKGQVLQEIDSLNGFVKIRILVDDPVTKDEIKRDGLRGLSPGYTTRIDKTPGIHPEFGPYDQIQRDRRYNHVAGTRKPRAGFAAHVRLDSGDAVMVAREDAKHTHVLPGGKTETGTSENTPDHTHSLPQGGKTDVPLATDSGGHTHEIPGRAGGGETGVEVDTQPKQDSVKLLPKVRIDGVDYELPDVETALSVHRALASAKSRADKADGLLKEFDENDEDEEEDEEENEDGLIWDVIKPFSNPIPGAIAKAVGGFVANRAGRAVGRRAKKAVRAFGRRRGRRKFRRRNSEDSREDSWLTDFNQAQSASRRDAKQSGGEEKCPK